MSRVTRQKHVFREMMKDTYELPEKNQQFVRIVRCCGNNLHEVESADTETENYLVTMPNKYRRNIWIKRGDVVLVEPIEEGKKVRAEICKILTSEHIKEYKKAGIWPERFNKKDDAAQTDVNNLLEPLNNHPQVKAPVDCSTDEDTSEDESDDDGE